MSILGDLFGSGKTKGAQSATETSSGTSKEQTKQTQKQTSQATSDTKQTETSQTSLLDQETVDFIKGLLGQDVSNGGINAGTQKSIGGFNRFLNTLTDRALGGQDQIDAQIAASQAEAKRQFKNTTGAQIAQTQGQTGSRLGNSFSQLLETQGNVELQTALQKIAADATIQGRAQQSAELQSIAGLKSAIPELNIRASQAGSSNITDLLNILRGSQATSTTDVSATTSSLEKIQSLLKSLTDKTSTATGTTTGTSTSQNKGLLGSLFG